eukprot:scaffold158082_cov39-Prasinocladus_malaysianus.AAC.1
MARFGTRILAAAVLAALCVGVVVSHTCPRSVAELHDHAAANSHVPGTRGALDALLDLHADNGLLDIETAFE